MAPRTLVCTALVLLCASGTPDGGPADADRAFAARALEVGVNAAFLEVLTEDGTLFRPGPVPGKTWMREHPDDGRLAWEPRVELVSAAGDLGVTFGPFSYSREERVLSVGHFLSVWTRASSEAPWKLAADIGTSHPEPDEQPDYALLSEVLEVLEGDSVAGEAQRTLGSAQAALGLAAAEFGVAASLLDGGHEGLTVLRNGSTPGLGLEASEALLEREPVEAAAAAAAHLSIASSADLAAEWGSLEPRQAGGPRGGWLRVWLRRADGEWKVLMDVRLPPG